MWSDSRELVCFDLTYFRMFLTHSAAGRTVPLAATRIYEMSFFTGFGISALVYWSLNFIAPAAGKSSSSFKEVDLSEESIETATRPRNSLESDKKEETDNVHTV
jgi:NCS1 family nucleobase:cation symporter-1